MKFPILVNFLLIIKSTIGVQDFFTIQIDADILNEVETYGLIKQFFSSKINCLSKCLLNNKCAYVTHKNGMCTFYDKFAVRSFISSPQSTVYKRDITSE